MEEGRENVKEQTTYINYLTLWLFLIYYEIWKDLIIAMSSHLAVVAADISYGEANNWIVSGRKKNNFTLFVSLYVRMCVCEYIRAEISS